MSVLRISKNHDQLFALLADFLNVPVKDFIFSKLEDFKPLLYRVV